MAKTLFLIPGFRMQGEHFMFEWLTKFLRGKEYRVVKVPVRWNYRTLTENASEFENFFNDEKSEENYILGFSYGAVITLMTASKLKPNKIYLCSLSPDFSEDRAYMEKGDRDSIGKKRYADTKTRSAVELAKELTVPSVIFYGEKEGQKYPRLKKRCEETAQLARNAKLVVVKDAPHDLSHPEYQKAIMSVII